MKHPHVTAATPDDSKVWIVRSTMGCMATRSEVLTKLFSLLHEYTGKFGLTFGASPDGLLQRHQKMSLKYDLDLDETEVYGLYAELSGMFDIDSGDFYESYTPTVGDLARLILSKVDID